MGSKNPFTIGPGQPELVMPERYVSRAELAVLMGVSLATVDRLVAEGMPSVTWGRRTREVSLRVFWERWTSDPLFARPKESTNIHNQLAHARVR